MQLATVLLLAALGSVTWGERSDAKTRVGGIDLAAAARVWGDGLQAPERTSENFAATTNSRRDVYSLGFTGHQYDPETGLVYARARYYDAEMGRFLSRDSAEGTIADAPSLHRFAYGRGNPLVYVDPSGHLSLLQPPNQDLIKQEMDIRWQQYQAADSPEGKAQALEKYRYWQGQLSERQDNDIFAEEVTAPMAVAAWTSAAAGPVAAEFTAVKVALAGVGVVGGSSEIREGAKQGGQLGTARVVAGVATVLASAAAVLPEGVQVFKWLRGKLTGETPAVATVVESRAGPGTAPVPDSPTEPAPAGGTVKTPWADPWTGNEAVQAPTPEARAVAQEVARTRTVYRAGQYDVQNTFPAEPGASAPKDTPLTWAPENPALMEPELFAKRYGFPLDKADWIEIARLKENATFVTRSAGPYGGNPGGAIEVVVEPTQIKTLIHTTP